MSNNSVIFYFWFYTKIAFTAQNLNKQCYDMLPVLEMWAMMQYGWKQS